MRLWTALGIVLVVRQCPHSRESAKGLCRVGVHTAHAVLRGGGQNLGSRDLGIWLRAFFSVIDAALMKERDIAFLVTKPVFYEAAAKRFHCVRGSGFLIVYATGYGSMNGWAATLISQDVADKVGKCWGLGSGTTKDPGPWEGELRNMWKATHQPSLWFHGGNLHQSRHYSQFLSLQIKARMEGISTPVYGMGDVHHLR